MKRTITRGAALTVLAGLVATTALSVESAEAQPAANGTYYIVNLKASNGQFVVAEYGGGREVKADRNAAGDWERFVLIDLNGGELQQGDKVRLRAQNGKFVVAENGLIKANRDAGSTWETFTIHKPGTGLTPIKSDDKVILAAWDNRWVCAENGGGREVKADRHQASTWEAFTLVIRSRLAKDPSPLGTTWTPPPPPPAPPPPAIPSVPAGYRWLGNPQCSPQTRLTAYLTRDAATGYYYCCELTANQNANTAHCGSGHIEFQPDCRQYAPRGQFMQPHGCLERSP
ncbi:MAG: hypothetical protein KF795_01775 [Labilithrix sp.]|nr:hypothetical protein [Labilithrix sp.]